ncbi:MAG: neutral zinc metallopeptidase [Bacteroidia bacterium]|nr:neutral zinc metallopeptidase [Bacteroidia bacterium]
MRWQARRASTNVADLRGILPITTVGGGSSPVVLPLLVCLRVGGTGQAQTGNPYSGGQPTGEYQEISEVKEPVAFDSAVHAETQHVWTAPSRRSMPEHRSIKSQSYHNARGWR